MKNNLHSEISKILDNTDFGLVLTLPITKDYQIDKKERAKRDRIYQGCINQLLALIKKHERAMLPEKKYSGKHNASHTWITGGYCNGCKASLTIMQLRDEFGYNQAIDDILAKLKEVT